MPQAEARPIAVLHTLPDLGVGGGQRLALRLAQALGEGFSHHVAFVRPPRDLAPEFERAGVRVHEIPGRGALGRLASARRLARIIRAHAIDVVHANNSARDRAAAFLASWWTRTPLVNTIHREDPHARTIRASGPVAAAKRAGIRAEGWIARRSLRGTLAVSRHLLDNWAPRLDAMGIAPASVRVAHPGIALDEFDAAGPPRDRAREALARELSLAPGTPILLCVARLSRDKGHEDLFECLRQLCSLGVDAQLALAGDGPDRSFLESRAREIAPPDTVHFLGNRADVPALLRAADLFLFASRSEGFGLAPLEAMAAGTPVLAYAIPALREFLDDDTGVLVDPSTGAPALAREAARLLRSPERRQRLALAARDRVERQFTMQSRARELADLYRSLADPRPEPR